MIPWMDWENDVLREHRFFTNEEVAELLLPHRSAIGVRQRRKVIGAEFLLRCKKCSAPFQKVSKWELCKDCLMDNNRSKNITHRFREYKAGAKRRGIDWDLHLNDFVKLWNSHCAYCDVKIEGIGIDRVDSKKGYTIKNTVACCSLCNRMKSTTPVDEWVDSLKRIITHHGATDGE